MSMMLIKIKRTVGAVFMAALAFALFAAGFWFTMRMIRDAVFAAHDAREAEVVVMGAAAEAETESAAHTLLVYREGDGPAPEWYRPDEPMAAEWYCATDTNVGGKTDEDTNVPDKIDYILDVPLSLEFQIYLHGLCEEAGIPYTLAVAVIEQESHYDPKAISPWNDWGLMQISHVCHAWLSEELGITDYLDPWQNVRAGVYILGGYYAKYGYESGTLVAYNQGQAAAEALFARGVYCTKYSDSVMGIRERLERDGR